MDMDTEEEIVFAVLPQFPGESENSHLKRISDKENRETCVFCRSAEVNEVGLGPLFQSDGVVTHYFCMLFSAGLSQKGSDRDGILGFFPGDIMSEVRRATRLRCIYCQKIGAAVGCCDRRCKASFHYPCGLKNGANFQFLINFESYCVNHSKKRTLGINPSDVECPICFSTHETKGDIIVGSCCKSAVFHKSCIQQHAFSAGYFFKCPICSSQTAFIQDMKYQGIFVPEQDAAWEREPNAYQELLHQYSHCDAEECRCPKGREYGAAKGQWLLARCRTCGAAGTHRECGKLSTIANWACGPCLEVETRTEKEKKTSKAMMKASSKKSEKSAAAAPVPLNLNSGGSTSANAANGSVSAPAVVANATATATATVNPKKVINRKARRTGIPVSALVAENDDDVNLNNIVIMPCCRDFFPHNKTSMQQYAKRNQGVPDWRLLELRVPLVDLFDGVVGSSGDGADTDKPALNQKAKNTTTPTPTQEKKRPEAGRVDELPGKRPEAGRVDELSGKRPPKTSTEKAHSRRRSTSWKRGIVKSRKTPTKAKNAPLAEQKKVSVKAGAKNGRVTSPAKASSSSKILEGIRRSQPTLISWLATASEPVKKIKTEPGVESSAEPKSVTGGEAEKSCINPPAIKVKVEPDDNGNINNNNSPKEHSGQQNNGASQNLNLNGNGAVKCKIERDVNTRSTAKVNT